MRWAFAGLLRVFKSFVEGARLVWALRGLGRLALASTILDAATERLRSGGSG